MDWIIYYTDGSTFSSDDGPPEAAPRRYVQIVMQKHPSKGREILTGYGNHYNFWCWQEGRWVPHDQIGLEQYLDAPGKEKIRLCGYWIADEKFSELFIRAHNHPDFDNQGNRLATDPPLEMPPKK